MTRQLDLTVQGVIGTHPLLSRVGTRQRAYCRFRVAVTPTYRTDQGWQNGDTMWFTAKAWGQLAENITRSLHKGDPVLLTGRLSEDTWEADTGRRCSNVIVLQSAGHDLTRGETRFMRIKPSEAGPPEEAGESGEAAACPGSAGSPGSAPSATTPGTAPDAGRSQEPITRPAEHPQLPADHWESGAEDPAAGPAADTGAPAGPQEARAAGSPGESASPPAAGASAVGQQAVQGPPRPDDVLGPAPLGGRFPQPLHRSADYEVVEELVEPAF